jgi:protein-S-isoprenylcysteine O-methyltransferase Ste14
MGEGRGCGILRVDRIRFVVRMAEQHLIFERQHLHAAALAILAAGLTASVRLEAVREGAFWGMSTLAWFWLAAAIAVLHQTYVWLWWRLELHVSGPTRALGHWAFPAYSAGFAILGVSRIAAVFALAIANQGALPYEGVALKVAAVAALAPAIYLFYSVQRYFGFARAVGIDHFDRNYRSMPFVREGIFRFSRNAMYAYGFLLLWAPAFWYGSAAALCIAAFNHLYIWVHYYTTELPDMRRIYGEREPT